MLSPATRAKSCLIEAGNLVTRAIVALDDSKEILPWQKERLALLAKELVESTEQIARAA